jgi:hypothetical protein
MKQKLLISCSALLVSVVGVLVYSCTLDEAPLGNGGGA